VAFIVVPCDLGHLGQHEIEVPGLKGACPREEADAVARLGGASCSAMMDLVRDAQQQGGGLCTAWCANCNRTIVTTTVVGTQSWWHRIPFHERPEPPCPLCHKGGVLRGVQVLT
jgi:hypothetical protein